MIAAKSKRMSIPELEKDAPDYQEVMCLLSRSQEKSEKGRLAMEQEERKQDREVS